MHRRKDLYGDDADAFRPERWEGSELANIGWGFMPFHGGPRICLGSKRSSTFIVDKLTIVPLEDFALMEASCGIVRIIQTFPNLRLPPGYPQEPTGQEKQALTIVISSADGCKVQLQ